MYGSDYRLYPGARSPSFLVRAPPYFLFRIYGNDGQFWSPVIAIVLSLVPGILVPIFFFWECSSTGIMAHLLAGKRTSYRKLLSLAKFVKKKFTKSPKPKDKPTINGIRSENNL